MSFVYSSAMKSNQAYPPILLTLVMVVGVGCGSGRADAADPTPSPVFENTESEVVATSTSVVEVEPTQLTKEQKAISLMWEMCLISSALQMRLSLLQPIETVT